MAWKEMIKGVYALDGSVKIGLAYTSFQGGGVHHSNSRIDTVIDTVYV